MMLSNEIEELPVAEACRKSGLSLNYFYTLLRTGYIKGRKVHGRWRIPVTAIQEHPANWTDVASSGKSPHGEPSPPLATSALSPPNPLPSPQRIRRVRRRPI